MLLSGTGVQLIPSLEWMIEMTFPKSSCESFVEGGHHETHEAFRKPSQGPALPRAPVTIISEWSGAADVLGCLAGVSGALSLIYSTEQSSFGVHAWNSSSWEVETGEQHLKVILGFTAEPIKWTGLDFLVIFWWSSCLWITPTFESYPPKVNSPPGRTCIVLYLKWTDISSHLPWKSRTMQTNQEFICPVPRSSWRPLGGCKV